MTCRHGQSETAKTSQIKLVRPCKAIKTELSVEYMLYLMSEVEDSSCLNKKLGFFLSRFLSAKM